MMLLSNTIINFIYAMMGLLIYKYEPLWQEVSVKSDTQVTVKACGPLVLVTDSFNTELYLSVWLIIEKLAYDF